MESYLSAPDQYPQLPLSRAILEMSHFIFPASLALFFLLLFEFVFALIQGGKPLIKLSLC